jgi:hypothetical protein
MRRCNPLPELNGAITTHEGLTVTIKLSAEMLTAADETLLHQGTLPMSLAAVSDHRHYDRHWFCAHDTRTPVGFILGMGCYKNMDVMDGFLSVQRHSDERQFNVRVSRPLRPHAGKTAVGPLAIEILEPFRKVHLRLDATSQALACDLMWTATHAAHLEANHVSHVGGTLVSDLSRYDQTGVVQGWIAIEGQRHELDRTWSVRDHSWGVRPGVGGFEPQRRGGIAYRTVTADVDERGNPVGILFIWSCFDTQTFSCQFQHREDAQQNVLLVDGTVHYHDGRAAVEIAKVEHDIAFIPGLRVYERARYRLHLANGETIEVDAKPLGRAWAYAGTGYDGGYSDGRGLGAQRGSLVEGDVYDLSHPEQVRDERGNIIPGGHREQPVTVAVNGETTIGHFAVMTSGQLPRYGLR